MAILVLLCPIGGASWPHTVSVLTHVMHDCPARILFSKIIILLLLGQFIRIERRSQQFIKLITIDALKVMIIIDSLLHESLIFIAISYSIKEHKQHRKVCKFSNLTILCLILLYLQCFTAHITTINH